jgi:hypothetical protein
MSNSFKAFASKEARNATTDLSDKEKFRDWNKSKKVLASTINKFGGKRLLGVTNKNVPIWASYTIDKETLSLQVKLSHDIETINNATFCPRRITVANGEQMPDIEHAMRPATQKDMGAVTKNTIRYIDKLFGMAESSIGKVDGKCSTQLFMYISNCIYEGSSKENKVRWNDIMQTWDMPSGRYFTVYG